ncbi:43111_t:CDS:1, partial [Gigaspora margarita]
SFEEIYGIQTTKNYRPSLVKSEAKASKLKIKYTMLFSPSAACSKNSSVIVNCTKCEKPHFFFSANKLSKKDKTLLRRFLDTIFYICDMLFHNTCDLLMSILPNQPEVNDNIKNTTNFNKETNQENIDKEDELDQFGSKSSKEEKLDENLKKSSKSAKKSDDIVEEFNTYKKDSINELFFKDFTNDLLLCDAKIKSYTILLEFTQIFASNVDI